MQQPSRHNATQWEDTVRDYLKKVEAGQIQDVTIVDDGSGDELE